MKKETPAINPAYVRMLENLVLNSSFPKLMGMRLGSIDIDSATLILDIDERHFQPFGIVHGGVLATLIDTSTFWASFMRLPPEAGLVNIDLKLNYLQPASLGRLSAVGRCVRPGRTISYAEAHVYDEQGALLAHGTSSLMTLPGQGIDLGVGKFLIGETRENILENL